MTPGSWFRMTNVDGTLLIGQLAQLAGVTVKAVRHYEKLGLIEPEGREPNGYRRYSPDAVVRVVCIARLSALGVPLARVAALLDAAPGASEVVDILIEVLEEEQERLGARLAGLRDLSAALADGQSPFTSMGSPLVDKLRELLGDAGASVPDAVWDVERRVAAMAAAFGLTELPPELEDFLKQHPSEVAELVEIDGLLAGLRGQSPDADAVAHVAQRVRRLRPFLEQLRGKVPPMDPGRAQALTSAFRPRVTDAQREALRMAAAD